MESEMESFMLEIMAVVIPAGLRVVAVPRSTEGTKEVTSAGPLCQ